MRPIKKPTSIRQSEAITEATQSSPMDAVMERLNRLEEENNSLRKAVIDADKPIDRHAKYTGPDYAYNFKTLDGRPVVKLETLSTAVLKDHRSGGYDDKQQIKVYLADGSAETMDYTLFGQLYANSVKVLLSPSDIQTRKELKNGENVYVKYYHFNHNGQEFDVHENAIN